MLRVLFIILYSLLIRFVGYPLSRFAALFSDRVKLQIEGRAKVSAKDNLLILSSRRRSFRECVVFFCSSAGEYEQSKPVIERLSQKGVFSHVFFFSRSGLDFATARVEKASFSLTPLDTWTDWAAVLSALRPSAAVVVRHEFWPAFFWTAGRRCPVYVLGAVPPSMLGRESHLKTKLSAAWKSWLFGFANVTVCAVNDKGAKYFEENVGVAGVEQIGDTKYDRVLERLADGKAKAIHKAESIRTSWKSRADKPILVLGSAHQPDLELVLAALKRNPALKVRLVVVPHDLSASNIVAMSQMLKAASLSVELIGDVEVLILDSKSLEADAILVDTMGHLSELYGLADLAFVGGAVHAKVHNVLEPAAWGLPLTCGLKFQNSQEACQLADAGLLQPTDDPKNLAAVWADQLAQKDRWNRDMISEVRSLSGASNRFTEILFTTCLTRGDGHA